jgi:hypothetical protein
MMGAVDAEDVRHSEPTVKELLVACDSSDASVRHNECDHVVGQGLMTLGFARTEVSSRAACVTFELTDDFQESFARFRKGVLAWLRARPDMWDKPETEAVLQATHDLYVCKEH